LERIENLLTPSSNPKGEKKRIMDYLRFKKLKMMNKNRIKELEFS